MHQSSEHLRARRAFAAATAGFAVALGLVGATSAAASVPLSAPAAASASSFAVPTAPLAVVEPTVGTFTMSTQDAEAALEAAKTALENAATLTVEIAGSGLELGVPDTSIDTDALREATLRLSNADFVPVLLFPALAEDAREQAQLVGVRVAELRAALESARAAKAAADAAAQAQREAEVAAAAKAEAEAAALAARNTPAGAKAVAEQLAAEKYGWGAEQFSCLVSLWQKESSWNYQAYNASSGATGIPQSLPGSKMASAGADWQTNAATQIAWGLDYISRAYGSPCGAWGKSQASGWY
jgi:hypothetical protein